MKLSHKKNVSNKKKKHRPLHGYAVELGSDCDGIGWVIYAYSKQSSLNMARADFPNHQSILSNEENTTIQSSPLEKCSFGMEYIEQRYSY